MEPVIALILALVGIYWVIKILSGISYIFRQIKLGNQAYKRMHSPAEAYGITESGSKKLRIKTKFEKQNGHKILGVFLHGRLNLSGQYAFPQQANITIKIKALDITEPNDIKPILCTNRDWSDENNVFQIIQNLPIPYLTTEFTGLPVGILPFPLLEFARKGKRKLKVILEIHSRSSLLISVEKKATYTNDSLGYIDFSEGLEKSDYAIVKLAVAVSSIDGEVDQREVDTIERFIFNRLNEEYISAVKKNDLLHTLRRQVKEYGSQNISTQRVGNNIKALCEEISSLGIDKISETAFQLTVEVTSSDKKIGRTEKKTIDAVKRHLKIEEEVAKQIEDRYIKINQFIDADDESKLGMPANLSDQEKKNWLSKEYGRWKNRVTHSDPVKSKEASDRLELITRCRNRISA